MTLIFKRFKLKLDFKTRKKHNLYTVLTQTHVDKLINENVGSNSFKGTRQNDFVTSG